MTSRTHLAAMAIGLTLSASAVHAVDLGQYRLTGTFDLPSLEASEASAVTWNWDTDTLFVLGDEGDHVIEVDRQGRMLSSMRLFGFDDTEGLTYLGGGQFAIVEERLQNVYRFTYTAGSLIGRAVLPAVSIGPTTGNTGLEGVSFDPLTGDLFFVKEKVPQALYQATVDFAAGTATVRDLVPRANPFSLIFGTQDLADLQVLSTVPGFAGTPTAEHLLVLSQETPRLMTVTRTGEVLSSFDLSAIGTDIEGVTIDASGTIFLVGETPLLYVLTPVPEPGTWLLLVSGAGVLAWRHRRLQDAGQGAQPMTPA
jgi:uncharacterized protein YjiK